MGKFYFFESVFKKNLIFLISDKFFAKIVPKTKKSWVVVDHTVGDRSPANASTAVGVSTVLAVLLLFSLRK